MKSVRARPARGRALRRRANHFVQQRGEITRSFRTPPLTGPCALIHGESARSLKPPFCPSKPCRSCGTEAAMKRDEIIATLKEREADLKAQGVAHAALFGSVARNETSAGQRYRHSGRSRPRSSGDHIRLCGCKALRSRVCSKVPVDVIDREALKPRVRPRADRRRHLCFLKLKGTRGRTYATTSPARCASSKASILTGFLGDDKTFYAATRCLEFISEASRRLTPAFKERRREIPWKAVAGRVCAWPPSTSRLSRPSDTIWRMRRPVSPSARAIASQAQPSRIRAKICFLPRRLAFSREPLARPRRFLFHACLHARLDFRRLVRLSGRDLVSVRVGDP